MDIKKLIRIGTVSSINVDKGTVRVAFVAQDNMVTYELPVITRGSKSNKDYWLPDIDEQVLCIFLPNISGRGVCEGFVLGTFYSSVDIPIEHSEDIHAVKFGDGSEIKHNRSTGKLTINVTGDIDIIAKGNVRINGKTINLNLGDLTTKATRLGDLDTGHDNCSPTALNESSNDVFINGKGAGRVGDSYTVHGCIAHPVHSGSIESGSSTVFINGKSAGRVDDSVSCGGSVAEGSENVFIGG